MWNSPIEYIESDVESRIEDAVFDAVQSVGIHVDRDELLMALAYDRGQYEKGYADGLKDADAKIVRCKDCRWWDAIEGTKMGYCHACKHCFYSKNWEISIYREYGEDWYCADGERKDE